MNIGARTAAWARRGAPLPYDAEVEWLQSDGGQRIDCGIETGSGLLSFDVRFAWADTEQSGYIRFAGVYGSTSARRSFMQHDYGNCSVRSGSDYVLCSIPSSERLLFHTLSISSDGTVVFDGTDKGSVGLVNPSSEMSLFSIGRDSGPKIKISDAVVRIGGVAVRDFIAVKKDGVGYLYDRVFGELFGNRGTDAFVIGPEKT